MTPLFTDAVYVACIVALAMFLVFFPQEKLLRCDAEQPDACILPILDLIQEH